MPSIRFLPADVAVEVPAGTYIHEAAIRAGLQDLELPCGGQARAVLRKRPGGCDRLPSAHLDEREFARERTMSPCAWETVTSCQRGCAPTDRLSPLFRYEQLVVPPVDRALRRLNRLVRARGPLGVGATQCCVAWPLCANRMAGHAGVLGVARAWRWWSPCWSRCEEGSRPAIDIGTTTVAAQLVIWRARPGTRTSYNQRFGVARTSSAASLTPEASAAAGAETVNGLIRDACGTRRSCRVRGKRR
jgi:hypothetical protein